MPRWRVLLVEPEQDNLVRVVKLHSFTRPGYKIKGNEGRF